MDELIRNMDLFHAAGRIRRTSETARTRQSAAVAGQATPTVTPTKSFHEVLESVKFSKHASERMMSRDIRLSDADYVRLEKGLGLAKQKGIRQTLIMMDDKVFIASVTNNTIITASEEAHLKDNVFTNIDGAVIV